jgi:hypothetical protein
MQIGKYKDRNCKTSLGRRLRAVARIILAPTLIFAGIAGALPAFADDDDVPIRKAGLWEITTAAAGMPSSPPTKICTDDAAEAAMRKQVATFTTKAPPPDPACKKTVQRDGNTITHDDACGGETHHTTYTIADDRLIRSEIHGRTTAPTRPGPTDISIKSEWVGACPAPLLPGDTQVQPQAGGPIATFNTITGESIDANGKRHAPARPAPVPGK